MKNSLKYLVTLGSILLGGCVFAPKEITYLDEGCEIEYKKLELDAQKLVKIDECNDQNCAYMVVAGAMLAPPTAIVSGSIVLVSRTLHWIEKKEGCKEIDPIKIPFFSDTAEETTEQSHH